MTLEEIGEMLAAENPNEFLGFTFDADSFSGKVTTKIRLWSSGAKRHFEGKSIVDCLNQYRAWRSPACPGDAQLEMSMDKP